MNDDYKIGPPDYDNKADIAHDEGHNLEMGKLGAESEYIPDTPEEKALLKKIDRHLLPMLWVM